MLGRVLYWAAVVIVSFVVLIALVLFLERRDESTFEGSRATPALGQDFVSLGASRRT